MATLPCPDGAGSINNPNGSPAQTGANNSALTPYVPKQLDIGEWQISSLNPDHCANTDQFRQESYVAEVLNISGAPINVYKLLGVHEQGDGSIVAQAELFASPPAPGFPVGGVNNAGTWKSAVSGDGVAGSAYVGADFGIRTLTKFGLSEYSPEKPKLMSIGALSITQSNMPAEFARQVKVEISDGTCVIGNSLIMTAEPDHASIEDIVLGPNPTACNVTFVVANDTSLLDVYATLRNGAVIVLGNAFVGQTFTSLLISATIIADSSKLQVGDMFSVPVDYVWSRVGNFNLVQSPLPQAINFKTALLARAVRIMPTLFSAAGNWGVSELDVLDSPKTDINNIQDLFFGENRDRDYAKEPVLIKAQYSPTDAGLDLSKFGISILDQYSFNASFGAVVQALGRPIVIGDIIEVIPEMQYDHNLKPVRKFLEVTDTGWAAEGFSTMWKPTVIRFQGQQALPSQETRDIFGTLDTQKYLVADSIVSAEQLDTLPLTLAEEIEKAASIAVPQVGSDDKRSVELTPPPVTLPLNNAKTSIAPAAGKPVPGVYIEDGLPPNGQPYTEGFKLPDPATSADGDYFRLYYAEDTNIPPRLYRFSIVKNRWLYQETDKRGVYSSYKPAIRNILESKTKQGLGKKLT